MAIVKPKDYGKYSEWVRESNKDLVTLHDNHRRPQTRREFLQYGLMKFSATLMFPTVLNAISNKAYAQVACESSAAAAAANNNLRFFQLNLRGGASLHQFLPMNENHTDTISNYDRLGLGRNPNTQDIFRTTVSDSTFRKGFVSGMLQVMSEEAQARTMIVKYPQDLQDDSSNNRMCLMTTIVSLGQPGTLYANISDRQNNTGIGARSVSNGPSHLFVRNLGSLQEAAGGSDDNSALGVYSNEQMVTVYDTISKVSEAQSARYMGKSGGENLQKGAVCGGQRNVEILQANGAPYDPREDANARAVYGIDADENPNADISVEAAVAVNVLNGNASVGSLSRGGYDYHNNPRTRTDGRDRDAGIVGGRVLELSHRMGESTLLYLNSDGSVGSRTEDNDNSEFRSDRGEGGMSIAILYDATPDMRLINSIQKLQVGHFTNGQAAEGPGREQHAIAISLAWAQLNAVLTGQGTSVDRFNQMFPGFDVARLGLT